MHQKAATSVPTNETSCSENRGSGVSSSRVPSRKQAFQITRATTKILKAIKYDIPEIKQRAKMKGNETVSESYVDR